MKSIRFLLAAVMFAGLAACARSQEAQVVPQVSDLEIQQALESSEDTLADLLSPEELAAEFGIASETHARFRGNSRPTDRLYIWVNKAQKGTSPTAQTMKVYLDGYLVQEWPVSTGREKPEVAKSGKVYNSVTPTGKFRIDYRSKNHVSQTWQAPMPFAQFFIGGIAIHATTPSHYAALGSRDSGGCVRLHLDNAKTIWGLVDQVGQQNVFIEIVDQAY